MVFVLSMMYRGEYRRMQASIDYGREELGPRPPLSDSEPFTRDDAKDSALLHGIVKST